MTSKQYSIVLILCLAASESAVLREDIPSAKEAMSRQDCIEMIEERRNPQHEPSWIDMFCLYFAYGLAKNDAINTATLAMEEADLDRNGVIDHNEMTGNARK